ncbi:MAG: formylglycine-generating enzyme family protein [Kiritimatiellia bacterium]
MNGFLLLASALYLGVPIDSPLTNASVQVERYESRAAIPGGEQDPRWRGAWILLRRIEPTRSTVTLGDPRAPKGARDEARQVRITRPYYIGVFETTREQLRLITGTGEGGPMPALRLSYNRLRGSVKQGIDWPATGHRVTADSILGQLRQRTGLEFDLPTEAQWEVACRAGTATPWNDGSSLEPYERPMTDRKIPLWSDHAMDRLGRYYGNGGAEGPVPVGAYPPNAWGLYDMHGNANEYCLDWFRRAGDPACAGDDPQGPRTSESQTRVIRSGGYWNYLFGAASACTSYSRSLSDMCLPSTAHVAVGFRLALNECER